ncbi:MAG: phage terminase large subunit [Pseudomonadota bacterium]|nr:phage terminase large subunit [Pseudomonadota bacterium]
MSAAVALSREELERRARAARELELRSLRRECTGPGSLVRFVGRFWHIVEPVTPLKPGWVLEAICLHLEAVSRGYITRLLINVPPGSMKSLLCNVFWPAWEWQTAPHTRWLSFSYAAQLTERDNEKFRDIITSPLYQAMWSERWQVIKRNTTKVATSLTGYKLATSVGGVGTGERGDRVVLDDPHNVREGESETVREATTDWFRTAMSNRLNDMETSAIVVIMQRVHETDVSGIILSNDLGYTHLMIPAEYEPLRHCTTYVDGEEFWSDPRERPKETFWPERFPRRVLASALATLGSYGYAGQYQQSPEPAGGGIFKEDWWRLWGNPEDATDPRYLKYPKMSLIVASLDGAYTEKAENDPSALTVWGVFKGMLEHEMVTARQLPGPGRDMVENRSPLVAAGQGVPQLMLMRAWQDRLTIGDVVRKTHETCKAYGVQMLLIEAKATGISVAQELRRRFRNSGYSVVLVDPGDRDKVARAYAAQPFFEQGNVWAPDREWAQMVIDEMKRFPKGAHDDLTDTTTQVINHLRKIGVIKDAQEVEADEAALLEYEANRTLLPIYPS